LRTVVIAAVCVLILLAVEIALVPIAVVSHRHTLPLEQTVGEALVGLAAGLHGGSQSNPLPQNSATLVAGRTAYLNCVQCHGAQGNGKGILGRDLYPPPADLLSANVKDLSDAQLYWIVKNGVSFTAMPGYGSSLPDRTIWAIVSYVRSLQRAQAPATTPAPSP
jgi:mono/diheme cytochrome c family protein